MTLDKRLLLPLDLQMFSADPPAGGNEPPAATPAATEPPAVEPPATPQTPPANPGGEKKVELTQAQLDAMIADRLRRDREAKGYDALQEAAKKWEQYELTQMSEQERIKLEYEKLQTEYTQLQTKLTSTEVEFNKTAVLTELGLPLTLKDRIHGSTAEEIRADALTLKEIVGVSQPKPPVGGGSNPSSGGSGRIFTKAELDRMSPDEVNQNWDTIQDQLRRGLIK
jgi:hypothetical protein